MDNFLLKNIMKLKNKFFLICGCIGLFISLNNLDVNAQAVGISATPTFTPNPSSILDVSSTTKGILIPRLTATQRTALQTSFSVAPATPANANGLMIYNTDSKKFNYWDGTKWNDVGAGSAVAPYWYFGSGAPVIDVPATGVSFTGAPNDYYYDNTTGKLYRKNSSNQWAIHRTTPGNEVINMKGALKTTVTETDVAISISIPANGGAVKRTFTVPNAIVGAVVSISPEQELPNGIVISYGRVVSAELVEIKFTNVTTGPINLPVNGAKYFISVLN